MGNQITDSLVNMATRRPDPSRRRRRRRRQLVEKAELLHRALVSPPVTVLPRAPIVQAASQNLVPLSAQRIPDPLLFVEDL